MTDLALGWNADGWHGDIAVTGGALTLDMGMRTAILISLFSDARAPDGAALPEESADRRGWWGDDFGEAGDQTGSLLWLISRAKITAQTLNQARNAALGALQWLIDDGIASRIDVTVEAQQGQRLAIGVVLERPEGPARERHDFTWEASA
ncbi:MAG: phage GP46 family protein [Blastomonas sp.]